MSVTLDSTYKILKLISEGGDSGNKKCKRGYGDDYDGSRGIFFWWESGVRRSVLFWRVWQDSGFDRREDVLAFNLLCKGGITHKFYFNAICKDNATINCIIVQHKNVNSSQHTLAQCFK
jgi:hypothetical protein